MTTRSTLIPAKDRELITASTGEQQPSEPAHVRRPLQAEASAEQADRASPDPCRNTDRYRLVTPFSLRL